MKYEFNKENLNKLINDFDRLSTETKKEKIIEDLVFLINYQSKLCELNNKQVASIDSKEITYFNPKMSSEDEFLKVLYSYIYILKSANYDFINALIKNMKNINDIWQ